MKRDPSMLSTLLATIANHVQPREAIADKRLLDAQGVASILVREGDGSVSVCVLAWDAAEAIEALETVKTLSNGTNDKEALSA
jgi:hypothetical protein